MAGIKIVDLPALGRDLASTDLFEMSIGGTASRKITGQEIMNASKLNVGSTPIVSGTVGRLLFQGTGNVLQQSGNLFWDDAALRLQVGSSSTSPFGSPLIFMGKDQNAETNFQISNSTSGTAATVGFRVFGANNRSTFLGEFSQGHTGISEYASHYVIEPNAGGVKHGLILSLPETTTGSDFMIYTQGRSSSNKKLTFFNATGNLLLQSGGTSTDAGFRLDVNGTARVQDRMDVAGTNGRLIFRAPELGTRLNGIHFTDPNDTVSYGYIGLSGSSGEMRIFARSTYFPTFYSNGSECMRIPTTGNVLINTTTDDGFRLDVNGTARVQGDTTITKTGSALSVQFISQTAQNNFLNVLNGTDGLSFTSRGSGTTGNMGLPANSAEILSFQKAALGIILHSTAYLAIGAHTGERMRLIASTGNLLINTTTDAGYKLDVNGTARVQGNITQSGANTAALGYITNGTLGVYSNAPATGLVGVLVGCVSNNGHTAIFTKGNSPNSTAIRITDQNVGASVNHLMVDYLGATGFGIANGTLQVNASAQVEIQSTTKGFLPPRMTNAQRTAIASPAVGLIVYCTDVTEGLWVYKSTGWTFIV